MSFEVASCWIVSSPIYHGSAWFSIAGRRFVEPADYRVFGTVEHGYMIVLIHYLRAGEYAKIEWSKTKRQRAVVTLVSVGDKIDEKSFSAIEFSEAAEIRSYEILWDFVVSRPSAVKVELPRINYKKIYREEEVKKLIELATKSQALR